MKTDFGHFSIDIGDGQREYVTALGLNSPEWSRIYPDRRAYMVLVANTSFGLMRLNDPIMVQDHENVTDEEVNQMLGAYATRDRKKITYEQFLKKQG